jgi:hypothetical protein
LVGNNAVCNYLTNTIAVAGSEENLVAFAVSLPI